MDQVNTFLQIVTIETGCLPTYPGDPHTVVLEIGNSSESISLAMLTKAKLGDSGI